MPVVDGLPTVNLLGQKYRVGKKEIRTKQWETEWNRTFLSTFSWESNKEYFSVQLNKKSRRNETEGFSPQQMLFFILVRFVSWFYVESFWKNDVHLSLNSNQDRIRTRTLLRRIGT